MKPSKSKSKVAPRRSHRIYVFSGSDSVREIIPNETIDLLQGVLLTLSDDGKSALIESNLAGVEVKINDVSIIDVAHLTVGDLLSIGNENLVLLEPLGVYIKGEKYRFPMSEDKIAQDLNVSDIYHKAKNTERLQGSENIEPNVFFINTSLRRDMKKALKAKKVIYILGLFALIFIFGGIFKLFDSFKNSEVAGQNSEMDTVLEDEEEGDLTLSQDKIIPEKDFTQSLSQTESLVDYPKSENIQATPQLPTIVEPKKSPPPTISPVLKKKMAAWHKKYLGYSLEARYDPNVGKKKLRALYQVVPKNTDLSFKIQEKINEIN